MNADNATNHTHMWTLPNILTIARMSSIPMVVFLLWPSVETRTTSFIAALVYVIAGIVDVIDGYVARRTNQVTVLGKFLDPLADKLLYLVTLIMLLQLPGDRVPGWVVLVMLTRELSITGLRSMAAAEGVVIAAGHGGKMKTSVATGGTVALMIHYPFIADFGFLGHALVRPREVGLIVTYLSVYYSLTSAWAYIRDFMNHMRTRPVAS